MSACCDAAVDRKSPTWLRRVREVLAWGGPGVLLVLMPKCPACLAAYVMLWTGIGLSFTTAAYLRWALLSLSVASLLFLMVKRRGRIRAVLSYFKRENDQCNTES